MRISNLIPITRIYDIYPKYTYSDDVKKFMDEIVDIDRANVYTKADVVDMLTELKNKLLDKSWNIDMYNDTLDFECCYLNDIDEVIQQKINALKEVKDEDCV